VKSAKASLRKLQAALRRLDKEFGKARAAGDYERCNRLRQAEQLLRRRLANLGSS
jgi:hypothetical protein